MSKEIEIDDRMTNHFECIDFQKSFDRIYTTKITQTILTKNNYFITHISAFYKSNCTICTIFSDQSIRIFDVNKINKSININKDKHYNKITDVRFLDENVFITSSLDKYIKIWDLRASEQLVTSAKDVNPITTMDTYMEQNAICTGSKMYNKDAFITFWDLRQLTSLGSFWEGHSDDITKVQFLDSNRLISSSLDNLINIYDLMEKSEDDALLTTFNCDSGVTNVEIIENQNGDYFVCSLTDINKISFWDINKNQTICSFESDALSNILQEIPKDYVNIIDIHRMENCIIVLINITYKSSNLLCGLEIGFSKSDDNHMEIKSKFLLSNNEMEIVSSVVLPNEKLLITVDDLCKLKLWQL